MVCREVRETGRGTSRRGPSGRPDGHPACRPLRISPFFLGHGNAAGVQCVFRRAGRGPGRRGQRSSGKSRFSFHREPGSAGRASEWAHLCFQQITSTWSSRPRRKPWRSSRRCRGTGRNVSPDWLARVRATPPGDPWALGFSVVERASGAAIGGCAFKGPPNADGMVEVAYGIDESHRCRGYASEAAVALTEFAFTDGRVRIVRAHHQGGERTVVTRP